MTDTVNIKFAKLHHTAKIPTKRLEDAGYDIYARFDEDYMVIPPGETRMIPTSIASACDENYCFILKERGSTGSKGIAQRCGVIDSGYRNEWFVPLTNTTDKYLFISKLSESDTYKRYWGDIIWGDIMQKSFYYPYSKAIAQALVIPVPRVEVEEVSYEELKMIESDRGMGALGSSNK